MRLSDARLHQRQTKALYLNHRSPPWLTEDATRDRSNRLLGDCIPMKHRRQKPPVKKRSGHDRDQNSSSRKDEQLAPSRKPGVRELASNRRDEVQNEPGKSKTENKR